MNPITVETRYTIEDYIRTESFLKNLKKPSPFIINFAIVFFFVYGLLNVLLLCITVSKNDARMAAIALLNVILSFLIICGLIAFGNVRFRLFLYRKKIKKQYDPNSIAYSEREIVFGEEGILEIHEFGKYLTQWQFISKVIETDDDFYFYLYNTVRFQPKRDLPEDQADALRILIKANLREKAEFQRLPGSAN